MKRGLLISMSILFSSVFILSLVFNIALIMVLNHTKDNEKINIMTKEKFLEAYAEMSGGAEIKIPIIEINTENEAFPQDKENYVNCSFKISNTGNNEWDFEKPMQKSAKSDGGIGIRLRGNATFYGAKKPFRIKFNEKTSLFGMEKNKSWVLLADYNDKSRMLNYTAQTLAKIMDGMDYSVSINHVLVFVNNNYQGLYLLTDQIDENKGRTDIKSNLSGNITNFPFLFEINRPLSQEEWLETEVCIDTDADLYGNIKYPEEEEVDNYSLVKNYVEEYMRAVWQTLKTGEPVSVSFIGTPVTFEDLVDVNSFVDFFIVNELMNNCDSGWRSCYVYKSIDGKLQFGPVWDFDVPNIPQNKSLMEAFLSAEYNYEFMKSRLNEKADEILKVIFNLDEHKEHISQIAQFDVAYWNDTDFNYYYSTMQNNLLTKYYSMMGLFNSSHEAVLNYLKTRENISVQ